MSTPNRPAPRFSSGDRVWTPADSQGIVSTVRWIADGCYMYGVKVGAMAWPWAEHELRPATTRRPSQATMEAMAGVVA